MKKNIICLIVLSLTLFVSCSFTSKKFENPDKDKLLLEVLQYIISNGHYSPSEIDDQYSQRVFDQYLSQIDEQKRYFLQSDINEFKKYQNKLDDDLKKADISFFDLTYSRFLQRMQKVEQMTQEILKKPFDFSKKETIDMNYDKKPFAKDEKELRKYWQKILTFSVLSNFVIKEKEEQAKKEKDAKYQPKSADELKKEAIENTQKTFEDMFSSMKDVSRQDWFGLYVNSFAEAFDPHTNYMAPNIQENFETNMAGKFEGIGAQLQKKSDGIRISSIILGGPVWKAKSLEVGDYILKVAQGDETPVDVVGMKLDEAIKLIKGPKGTQVNLTVKKVDGTIEVVAITRDIVEIEETYAKSALIKEKDRTYGIIHLPKFYINMNDYQEKNAASDMEQEIIKLKKSNIDGMIIDLRDNGGGSLKAVVDIAGMFIEEGPVVQVRQSNGSVRVLNDTDKNILWDKPLVILINELSASASEILAAAMQDYQRAIVIGSKQSFGKGTVQSVVEFDKMVRNNSFGDLGAMKLTMQKFYRIDGGSTQLKGVNSDIVVPDKYAYIEIGERDFKHPMEWDRIEPTKYTKWTANTHFATAIANSQKRIAANDYFKMIDQNALWVKQQQDQNTYPLNYQLYKKRIEDDEAKSKEFKAITNYKSGLKFQSAPSDEILVNNNEDLKLRRDRWFEVLEKDLYIEEAVHVLDDLTKK